MSGFFGSISKEDCVSDVFYGTDYHSHLGTKRAGLVFYSENKGFQRAIHSLEDGYFRNKFDGDIAGFKGKIGLGVISDTEAQPIQVTSYLGKFAVATVSKIVNNEELEERFMQMRHTFAETSQGSVNPTELVAKLIAEGTDFLSGIENVYNLVKGSCSILILTENSIIAARDRLGRTPIRELAMQWVTVTKQKSLTKGHTQNILLPGHVVSCRKTSICATLLPR